VFPSLVVVVIGKPLGSDVVEDGWVMPVLDIGPIVGPVRSEVELGAGKDGIDSVAVLVILPSSVLADRDELFHPIAEFSVVEAADIDPDARELRVSVTESVRLAMLPVPPVGIPAGPPGPLVVLVTGNGGREVETVSDIDIGVGEPLLPVLRTFGILNIPVDEVCPMNDPDMVSLNDGTFPLPVPVEETPVGPSEGLNVLFVMGKGTEVEDPDINDPGPDPPKSVVSWIVCGVIDPEEIVGMPETVGDPIPDGDVDTAVGPLKGLVAFVKGNGVELDSVKELADAETPYPVLWLIVLEVVGNDTKGVEDSVPPCDCPNGPVADCESSVGSWLVWEPPVGPTVIVELNVGNGAAELPGNGSVPLLMGIAVVPKTELELETKGAEPVGTPVMLEFEAGNGGSDEGVALPLIELGTPVLATDWVGDKVSEIEKLPGPLISGEADGTYDDVPFDSVNIAVEVLTKLTVVSGKGVKVNAPVVEVTWIVV
jgi:hypothetical protein